MLKGLWRKNRLRTPLWMPSHWAMAQTAHIFIAGFIVMTTVVMGGRPWAGFWTVWTWALCKDFIFDIIVEDASLFEETVDFLFYVGAGLAAALFCVWWHG